MAWDSGQIVSSTPWPALSTKIKALFGGSGVANWSFVENIPAGTGAGQSGSASFSVDVYKCSGSGTDANDAGTDWYFGLPIPEPTTGLTIASSTTGSDSPITAESYDETNKKFKRQCIRSNGVAVSTDANGYFNDTYATWYLASKTPIAEAAGGYVLNTTGFGYYIKLTKNFLLLGLGVSSTQSVLFAGLFDSVTAVSDSIPLATFGTTRGGWHRLPGVNNISFTTTGAGAAGFQMKNWTDFAGTSNANNAQDAFQSGKVIASRLHLVHNTTSQPISVCGALRGLLKSDILCFNTGGTVNLGDTMVIAGDTWTVTAPAGLLSAWLVTRAV